MNELLQAAKDMVEWFNSATAEDAPVDNLCAAVERAEKQEAGFDKWFDENIEGQFDVGIYESSKAAWTAAQQAEQERCRKIIKAVKANADANFAWEFCCEEILEKIDAAPK